MLPYCKKSFIFCLFSVIHKLFIIMETTLSNVENKFKMLVNSDFPWNLYNHIYRSFSIYPPTYHRVIF